MDVLKTTVASALESAWVRAALVIVGSILAAWVVRVIVLGLLLRITRRTGTTLDDRLLGALRRPVFVSVVLVGLHVATGLLGLGDGVTWTTRALLKTVAILLWTGALFRVCTILLAGLSVLADRVTWLESRTLPLFDNLAKVLLVGLALYALLLTWELNVGPWLASAGIVGIAVGFAAKDTLANLFGGIFILADAPFKIGDYVVLDSGERGMVTRIGLRSCRILTRDDIEITLPNAVLANSKIINESGGPYEKARVALTVGVAYGSDVDQVRRVLLEAAHEQSNVVDDPPPRVRFTSFGDSSLVFRLLCWVDRPASRGRVIDAVNTAVYRKFQQEGIEIPFPQRVVHLHPTSGKDEPPTFPPSRAIGPDERR